MDNLETEDGRELELLSEVVNFSVHQRWITEKEQFQIKTESKINGLEKALFRFMKNSKSDETASKLWCAIRCINEMDVPSNSADDEHTFHSLIMSRLFEKALITEKEKLEFETKLKMGNKINGTGIEEMICVDPSICMPKMGVAKRNQFQRCRNPLVLTPVIERVFRYLDTRDVKKLRLVSKEWNSAGLGLLFTRATIKFDAPINMSNFLQRFSKTSFETIPFKKFTFLNRGDELWTIDTIEEFLKRQGKYITELKFEDLQLVDNYWSKQKLGIWSITSWISIWRMTKGLKTNDITKLSVSFDVETSTHISVDLNALVCIKELTLKNVTVNLQDGIRISPTKLNLAEVNFTKYGSQLDNLHLNEIFDFSKATHVDLKAISSVVPLSLELNGDGKLEHLSLLNFTLLNFETCRWEVNKLNTYNVTFPETTQMLIKELNVKLIFDCSDIYGLPMYIEKLSLVAIREDIFSFNETIVLSHIKFLHLSLFSNIFSLYTQHLKFPKLTHLYVENTNVHLPGRVDGEIDLASISNSVKFIHLTRMKIINTENKEVSFDRLILKPIEPFNIKIFCGSHVSTKELVLDFTRQSRYTMIAIIDILEHQNVCRGCVQRFYIGPFYWTENGFDVCPLRFYVDRKAKYYLVENQKVIAIEQKEFDLILQDWDEIKN